MIVMFETMTIKYNKYNIDNSSIKNADISHGKEPASSLFLFELPLSYGLQCRPLVFT